MVSASHAPLPTHRESMATLTVDTAEPELQYVSAKEVEATSLPANLFTDRVERERKRIPHLLLVRNLRFSAKYANCRDSPHEQSAQ